MSHDFVEAAFLARAGYAVWLLPDTEGSYEELPGDAIAFATRDRRWRQGNLQHLRLIGLKGLTLPSRLHLVPRPSCAARGRLRDRRRHGA